MALGSTCLACCKLWHISAKLPPPLVTNGCYKTIEKGEVEREIVGHVEGGAQIQKEMAVGGKRKMVYCTILINSTRGVTRDTCVLADVRPQGPVTVTWSDISTSLGHVAVHHTQMG